MWRVMKLKDLCKDFKSDIVDGPFGSNLKSEHFQNEGVPVLKIQNIKEFNILEKNPTFVSEATFGSLFRHSFKKNDLVMTKLGQPLGVTALVKNLNEGIIVADLVRIRPDTSIVSLKYMEFLLNSPSVRYQINKEAKGATRPRINLSIVRNLELVIPPLTEQHRIVAKLEATFAQIDKLHQSKMSKLANIQRLSAQRISQLVNELIDNCGKTLLSDVCVKITKGSSPKWQGINYVDEPGILFITSENVGNGKLRLEKIKYVENKFNEKDSKSILQKGDVLTNIVGASIGRTAVFDLETSISANINQAVCLLRTDEKRLNPHFLCYLLNSDFFLNALHDGETSTARANISLGFISSLEIPLPTLNEQILFLDECEAITNACAALSENSEKQSFLAERLKSAILAQELQTAVA